MTFGGPGPASPAVCHWLCRDGTAVAFTAVARQAPPGLDPYKCEVPGSPELARRMRTVVSQARLTEPRFDSRSLVHLSVSTASFDTTDPHWELAAVLADRLARGRFSPLAPRVWAHGESSDWTTGRVVSSEGWAQVLASLATVSSQESHAIVALSESEAKTVTAQVHRHTWPGELTILSHLGGLIGHPDAAEMVSRASAWFPLIAGGDGANDNLARVDVAVREFSDDDTTPRTPGPTSVEAIEVNGLPWNQRHAAASVLGAARMLDKQCTRRWHTVVSFSREFHMNSYELALVLADRLARGRLLPPRGRLIATGTSESWSTGTVASVEGLEAKCRLIARQAARGDRVLVPKAWWLRLPPSFDSGLRARGASLAPISELCDLGALSPSIGQT